MHWIINSQSKISDKKIYLKIFKDLLKVKVT